MKINQLLLAGLLLCAGAACSDDDNTLTEVLPDSSGSFTDARDGNEYGWVRYGQLEWMTGNIRYAEAASGVSQLYAEEQITQEEREAQQRQNYVRYGYLYDFEAAQEAVPAGWRIPTDEDWKALERAFGLPESETAQTGWRGAGIGELLQRSNSLYLRPGGFIDYQLSSIGEVSYEPNYIGFYGFFWSATTDPAKTEKENKIYRQIRYNSSRFGRFSTYSEKLLSLRCVRDAQ